MRPFFVNIIILFLVNLLVKPLFIFGIEIPVQNTVGNEAYGMFFTFINLAFILQIIGEMGLESYASATIPKQRSKGMYLLINGLALKSILLWLLLLAYGLVGNYLGYWTEHPELFWLVIAVVFAVTILQFVRATIAGFGYYKTNSVLSAMDKLIMLILIGYALFFSDEAFTMVTFAYAQLIAVVITIGLGLYAIRREMTWVKPSFSAMYEILINTYPLAITIVLMFAYTRIDAIMIEQMMDNGKYHAGLYASAYRLYDAAAMFAILLPGLIQPMFAHAHANRPAQKNLYKTALFFVCMLTSVIALPMIIYRSEIMETLYVDTTHGAMESLGFLMVAFMGKAFVFITSALMTVEGRIKQMNVLLLLTLLLNVVLNYLYIPRYGIMGAAAVTALTQWVVAIAYLILIEYNKIHRLGMSTYYIIIASLFISFLVGRLFEIYLSQVSFIVALFLLATLLGLIYLAIFGRNFYKSFRFSD